MHRARLHWPVCDRRVRVLPPALDLDHHSLRRRRSGSAAKAVALQQEGLPAQTPVPVSSTSPYHLTNEITKVAGIQPATVSLKPQEHRLFNTAMFRQAPKSFDCQEAERQRPRYE